MNKTMLLALGLALTWQLASAGDSTFEALDRNADGLITTEEAQADADVVDAFGDLDVNGDGFLTLAEYSAIEMGAEG